MTDYDEPVEALSLEQVQKELRSYKPGTAQEIEYSLEFAERRSRLWRRLDLLVNYGRRRPTR